MLAIKNADDMNKYAFLYYEGEIVSVEEENELGENEGYITRSYALGDHSGEEFIKIGDCTRHLCWDEYYHQPKKIRRIHEDMDKLVLCETTDVREYVKNHIEKYSSEEAENMDDDDLNMIAYEELDSNYYEDGISYSEMVDYYPISGKYLPEAIEELLNDYINLKGNKPSEIDDLIGDEIKAALDKFVGRFGEGLSKEYNIKLKKKVIDAEYGDAYYTFGVYIAGFDSDIEISYEAEADEEYAELDIVE